MDKQVRPFYETTAHLSVEQRIAAQVEHKVKCQMIKLPIRYHLDYAIKRDKIEGFAEIKTTKWQAETVAEYGGYKISLAKWCNAEQMCRLSKVPFVLLIGFPDGIRYLKTTNFEHDGVVWWGRKDRGDLQDMEPAVNLYIERFKML